MNRRTKLVSLLAGIAAAAALVNVPAFANDPSSFVLVSNRDLGAHNITLTEYNQSGAIVRGPKTWSMGSKKAHYWTIGTGNWVAVSSAGGLDQKLAATDLPACFRITGDPPGEIPPVVKTERVTVSCNTDGATETSWE
jgi:hypothetical protein